MNSRVWTSLGIAILLLAAPTAHGARLWSSGCEFQSDAPGNITAGLEFTAGESLTTEDDAKISTAIKRSGESSCHFNRDTDGQAIEHTQFVLNAVATDVYARVYIYIVAAPSEAANILTLWDRGVDALEGAVALNTDRTLSYRGDTGAADGTGSTVLALNTWYRIELNYDATDQAIVYIDGVQEIDASTHDGDSVDTIGIGICHPASGDTGVCGADLAASGEWHMDDIAVNDTSGTAQTGLPGAGSIVHMQPNAAGDANGCSAGDVTSVDEVTPDDGTSVCVFDADADILDVNAESSSNAGIGSSDAVTLVQVGIREGSVTGTQSQSWQTRVKSAASGSVTSSATIAHNDTTYKTNGDTEPLVYRVTSYTDPTTAVAWTPTGTNSLDNMQIGATAIDATPDINVTTIWGLVEYVPAAAPAGSPVVDDVWFF